MSQDFQTYFFPESQEEMNKEEAIIKWNLFICSIKLVVQQALGENDQSTTIDTLSNSILSELKSISTPQIRADKMHRIFRENEEYMKYMKFTKGGSFNSLYSNSIGLIMYLAVMQEVVSRKQVIPLFMRKLKSQFPIPPHKPQKGILFNWQNQNENKFKYMKKEVGNEVVTFGGSETEAVLSSSPYFNMISDEYFNDYSVLVSTQQSFAEDEESKKHGIRQDIIAECKSKKYLGLCRLDAGSQIILKKGYLVSMSNNNTFLVEESPISPIVTYTNMSTEVEDPYVAESNNNNNISQILSIRFISGEKRGERYSFNGRRESYVRVGRTKECHIQFNDLSISVAHCYFSFKGGIWSLREGYPDHCMKSLNGTYIVLSIKNSQEGRSQLSPKWRLGEKAQLVLGLTHLYISVV